MVSRPNEGGVSIRTKSYRSETVIRSVPEPKFAAQVCSTSAASAVASADVGGHEIERRPVAVR